MESPTIYLIAADAMLLLHILFVSFVVFGLVLIFVGKLRTWHWVRNPWFRLLHLVAISVVMIQSWFGVICPFTTFELALRSRAGDAVYAGSFIGHWLEELLYFQLPPWVFVTCYSLFAVIVAVSWLWIRPRSFNAVNSGKKP